MNQLARRGYCHGKRGRFLLLFGLAISITYSIFKQFLSISPSLRCFSSSPTAAPSKRPVSFVDLKSPAFPDPPKRKFETLIKGNRAGKEGKHTYYCGLIRGGTSQMYTSKIGNLAAFILFQSNGGHQLQQFVKYHRRIIGMENIVIIDHQSQRNLSDSHTDSLLDKYNHLGSDVWQCDGLFHYKEKMWSAIIHQYTNKSEWVFPLDVDEFVAVKVKKEDSFHVEGKDVDTHRDKFEEKEELRWNAEEFTNALSKLPDSEKPFKMENGIAFPTDCGDISWDKELYFSNDNVNEDDMNHIQFVGRHRARTSGCTDKSFFRSKDFNLTDTGNHVGQTHKYSNKYLLNCTLTPYPVYFPTIGWKNETVNKHDLDQESDLYVIHAQQLNFGEWLLHSLRGASDRSFNRFSDLVDCSKVPISSHYCYGWEKLLRAEMNPKEMKKIYRKDVCEVVVKGHFPLRVGHLFEEGLNE